MARPPPVAMVLLLVAGCAQAPTSSVAAEPEWIPITIQVVRSQNADFGAQAVPAGAPAPRNHVGFIYRHETVEDFQAVAGREPTPTDPACRGGSIYMPACGDAAELESYRVPRDIDGAKNILEIVGRFQPLGADGQVTLLFADSANVFFQMAGPASLDYPVIQEEANGGVGCSHYRAKDVRVLWGDAEVTSTPTSAPGLRFWGPAGIEVGWSAFPSGCA